MSGAAIQPSTFPTISWTDSVRFTLLYAVPIYLQGLFTRHRFWVTAVSYLHPDPVGVRLVARLRKKYSSRYLFVNIGRTKTLLVLDEEGIRRVLENSPGVYAESTTKRLGMSRFQPGAVTISREPAWRDRRRFNEQVLQSNESLHRLAASFVNIARDEVLLLLERAGTVLKWRHTARLFERLTLRVLFGRSSAEDVYLTRTLTRLMRNGNHYWLLPPNRQRFDNFYAALRGRLRWPAPDSLAAICREVSSSQGIRVESQLVHWMFAMNETLAANTTRAWALITASDAVQDRVREELASADIGTPQGIDGLNYLGGCLQEAMRLWPTTPILQRTAIHTDILGGRRIPSGTELMILNSFNHRDRESDERADRFDPDSWANPRATFRFNHLSNGSQACAGRNLALFLGKAVLAWLMHQRRYGLIRPAIDLRRPLPHAMNYFRTKIQRLD